MYGLRVIENNMIGGREVLYLLRRQKRGPAKSQRVIRQTPEFCLYGRTLIANRAAINALKVATQPSEEG